MKKSLDSFKEGRNSLIKKLGEENDDLLVKTAIKRLSNEDISLKTLVDEFRGYKKSVEFEILVPNDVSFFFELNF